MTAGEPRVLSLTLAHSVVALLCVALAPLQLHAENQPNGSTIVSPQTTSGTWGPGTITADRDVLIQSGVVIDVAAGTTVRVTASDVSAAGADTARVEIVAQSQSQLRINGTAQSGVTFTSAAASPAAGNWYGVVYAAQSSGVVSYATIEYGVHALTIGTSNAIAVTGGALRHNRHAPTAGVAASGAGLTLQLGNHTVSGTEIWDNALVGASDSTAHGAGVYIAGGAPSLTGLLVHDNLITAGGREASGAGITVSGANAVIDGCSVNDNTIQGGTGAYLRHGAGIAIRGSTAAEVRGCWLEGNRCDLAAGNAGGGGIGLGLGASAALIDGNVVYNNYVSGPGWSEAGGIDLWEGNTVTVSNNLIVGNTTGVGGNISPFGGGMLVNASSQGVRIINNTFVDNQAIDSGNGEGRGGGLYVQDGTVVARNNIFVGNEAGTRGGGVFNELTAAAVDFNDSWGNTAPSDANTSGAMGASNISANPYFLGTGALAAQYHIPAHSPAMDLGDAAAPGAPADDFDGQTRPQGGAFEMGFDEVAPVAGNAAPVVAADSYQAVQDTALTIAAPGVLGNDSDADGDAMTAVRIRTARNGTLSLAANGSFTYTPAAGFTGTDLFAYRAHDGVEISGVAVVTIEVRVPNTPPVAADDSYQVDEDATLTVAAPGVLGNDSDGDGDALDAILDTDVAHGTLTLNLDGSFSYTPAADYHGDDSFTYVASDGVDDSSPATVTITVDPINDLPVARADSYSTAEDTTLSVPAPGVLGNDSDADGDTLTAVLDTDVTHGTLTLNSDGSFTYLPDPGYAGGDSFAYEAADGTGSSSPVAVTITVTAAANTPPVATADSYSTNEDTALSVAAPGVLGNDSDGDGDALQALLVGDASHGDLTLNSDGSFTYTPDANYAGSDSFTYQATDGVDNSATVTVTLTITAQNDPPVAANDAYTVEEDGALSPAAPGVLGNDSDVEGSPLTAQLVSDAAHGTLSLNANGTFTYTPDPDYSGPDSFTYQAHDGTAASGAATVSITVTPRNDAPVANGDSYNTAQDTPLVIATPGVLSNDSDPDGDALTAELDTDVSHGTLTLNADGSFTYTPESGFIGSDSFTYLARDAALASSPATVTIQVTTGGNTAPTAADDSYTTEQDATLNVAAPGVLRNDSDAEGDTLTAILESDASNGTIALSASGSFAYVPDSGFTGTDSFTYHAHDGAAASAPATVTITVTTQSNVPPAAAEDAYTTAEDAPLTITAPGVLGNDTDADGDALIAVRVSDVSHGTLAFAGDGGFTYTPAPDFYGVDSFTYQAADGLEASTPVAVEITVTAVNDPPRFVDPTPSGPVSVSAGDAIAFTVAAEDPEGDPVSYALETIPEGASFDAATGSFSWTPAEVDVGSWSLVFSASDGVDATTSEIVVEVTAPDADGDGVPDSVEVALGLDPNNPDTDGDTISDGDEVGDLAAPADEDSDGTIDALDPDSDGDGVADADEAGDAELATPPVDSDGDGVADFRDADSDDDGAIDASDNCRLVSNPDQADGDGDGFGDLCDPDRDADGFANGDDNCPDDSNPGQADLDGDGEGDACDRDVDGDGVANADDNCTRIPNPAQNDWDQDGVGRACDPDEQLSEDAPYIEAIGCSCGAASAHPGPGAGRGDWGPLALCALWGLWRRRTGLTR